MMKRSPALTTILLVVMLAAAPAFPALASAADQKGAKGLAAESLWKWQFVGDPQITPDGSKVAYVHVTVDEEKDGYKSSIWLADTATGKLRQMTTSDSRDFSPRWSPDGSKLAFLSTRRGGAPQIFILTMDGGEAKQITTIKNGASNIEWSPDGRRIAFNSRVTPKKDEAEKKEDEKKDEGKQRAPKERTITRLIYRVDGAGYLPEGFSHIFTVPAEGGEAKQVTEGDFNHNGPAWSPDSRSIAFSAVRKPDAEYQGEDSEIYVVAAEGGQVKALTDRRGPDGSPVWSPDGRQIAYTGFDEKMLSHTTTRLYVMNSDGTGKRELTASYDRSIADGVGGDVASPMGAGGDQMVWSSDGKQILFTSADRGTSNIHAVPAAGGAVRDVTKGEHDLGTFSLARNGRAAAIISTPAEPYDLYTFTLGESTFRRLTSVNAENLKGLQVSKPETFWYKSFDGRDVQGWVIKPVGFVEGKKYPMLLYIHGGPHANYGNNFFHEFHFLASRGYVVVYTNPRGSTSYGQDFANVIQYHYPGDDYKDLMAGVDEIIKRGYVDATRLGVLGGSGGGVLTVWTIGHTDRFAAAIGERGVYDWSSFVTTADFNLTFVKRWFRDFPWNDPEDYRARSPINYVKNIKTPLLIVHYEEDYRVPISQGEELYTALKMLKRDVKMIRVPQESHGLSRGGRPSHRVNRLNYIVGWMDEHLKRANGQ